MFVFHKYMMNDLVYASHTKTIYFLNPDSLYFKSVVRWLESEHYNISPNGKIYGLILIYMKHNGLVTIESNIKSNSQESWVDIKHFIIDGEPYRNFLKKRK